MSYYLTCSLTKLPIESGEDVYVLPLSINDELKYKSQINKLTKITTGEVNYTVSYSDIHYKCKYGLLEGEATDSGTIEGIKDSFTKRVMDAKLKTDVGYVFSNLHARYEGTIVNPILKDYHVVENVYGSMIHGNDLTESLIRLFRNTKGVKEEQGVYTIKMSDNKYEHTYRYTVSTNRLSYSRTDIKTQDEVYNEEIDTTTSSMETITSKIYEQCGYLIGIKQEYQTEAKELMSLRYMVVKKRVYDELEKNVARYGWFNSKYKYGVITDYVEAYLGYIKDTKNLTDDEKIRKGYKYKLNPKEQEILSYYDITKILSPYIEGQTRKGLSIDKEDVIGHIKAIVHIKHIYDVSKVQLHPQMSCVDDDFNLGIHKDLQKIKESEIKKSRYEREDW